MSKESKNLMSANDLADILRIIDEEPELPGDMSDDLWNRLRGYDRDGLTEALRILVRTTKDCISERILEQVGDKDSTAELFVVRFYDGFDNQWMDVSAEVSKIEADRIWNEKTKYGKVNKEFYDIDYYKIFPADTKMIYSDGFGDIGK